MKASRTINWYFGLCSIVKVCCEMVPIKRQVFLFVILQRKILIYFLHFTKMCKILLKLAYDVDFGLCMEALLFYLWFFQCISTIAWNGKQDSPFPKIQLYAFNLWTTFHPCVCCHCLVVLMYAAVCLMYVLYVHAFCLSVFVCMHTEWLQCLSMYRISGWIKKATRDFSIYGKKLFSV